MPVVLSGLLRFGNLPNRSSIAFLRWSDQASWPLLSAWVSWLTGGGVPWVAYLRNLTRRTHVGIWIPSASSLQSKEQVWERLCLARIHRWTWMDGVRTVEEE